MEMLNMSGKSLNDMYFDIFDTVRINGSIFQPRDKGCMEIRPASMTFTSPHRNLYTGQDRRLNYSFFAIETLCYIVGFFGQMQATLLLSANKNMAFALNTDTQKFDGAYGKSLRHGIPRVCKELGKDTYSRRALISMWEHVQNMNSKDIPCTSSMHFFADKNDSLSMHVYMRSNDLNWGLPYDVAAFSAIQLIVAAHLGWLTGSYYHTVGSLHYYLPGNSDGAKPPTLIMPTDLSYKTYSSRHLTIPRPPSQTRVEDLIDACRMLLFSVHKHICDTNEPLHTFELEKNTEAYGIYLPYIQHWVKLIRTRLVDL